MWNAVIEGPAMKILLVTHRVPYPPNKGDKIRSFHELEFLARRHDIYLGCLAEEGVRKADVETVQAYCKWHAILPNPGKQATLRSLSRLPGGQPLTLPYFWSSQLAARIRDVVQREHVDHALAFSSSMAQYVVDLPCRHKVIDFVDVDSEKWRQYAAATSPPFSWVYALEARRMRAYEKSVARRFQHCVFSSSTEVEIFRTFAKGAHAEVIVNGVDYDYFHPNGVDYDRRRVVFCGAMDYYPNVDGVLYFVNEIWPMVRAKVPDAVLCVAGRSPAPEIRALGERPDIDVTGEVADIRPYVQRAAVSVASLRVARGIQNKVLEAMSMGTPVVATPEAREGIDGTSGEHLIVAGALTEFAEAVVDLMQSPTRRRCIGQAGRDLVVEHYRWDARLARLETLLGGQRADLRSD